MTDKTCPNCATLAAENQRLREQLCLFDPIFGIRQSLPNDAEAAALLKIVCGRYPHLKENADERERIDNFTASMAFRYVVDANQRAANPICW
jgi:hypothetical protein